MAQSPCFFSPCQSPFTPVLCPLYLLGNPSCCDRIRPPWSQLTRKLTSPSSTLSHSLPLQIPSTQVNKRPTTTTSRIRILLSRTIQYLAKEQCSGRRQKKTLHCFSFIFIYWVLFMEYLQVCSEVM
jgi:hypothetical protein